MKVYTKKNNGLRLLGEGMVFSKKELMLREEDGTNNTSITSQDQTTPSQLPTVAQNALNKNPNQDDYIQSVAKLDGKEENNGSVLTLTDRQAKTSQGQRDINNYINMSKNTNNGDNNQIRIVRNRLVAHKTPRKVMDEMRANSVPFTKTELTKFLKSI